MTKLNNGGWGVGNMITFLIIFILFLIIIAFLVYDMDHEKESQIHLVEEEFIIFR
ncbi:MAG TPA: hypothetical protein IAB35_03930 [Candidatus Faecimonas gallistercoris]|nr:hypothetical protein [Candidatus Faecimonas gallistercoris]